MKTRDHLKKAITRIVELEKKDISNTERINQLELKLALIISKLDQLGDQEPDDDDNDSLDDKWEKTGKDDIPADGSKPPVLSSQRQSNTKNVDTNVQENREGRSGEVQGPDDDLDSELQQNILSYK